MHSCTDLCRLHEGSSGFLLQTSFVSFLPRLVFPTEPICMRTHTKMAHINMQSSFYLEIPTRLVRSQGRPLIDRSRRIKRDAFAFRRYTPQYSPAASFAGFTGFAHLTSAENSMNAWKCSWEIQPQDSHSAVSHPLSFDFHAFHWGLCVTDFQKELCGLSEHR